MAESTVFNADCMEVMRQYPDGYFDLAVVDPPYGINAGKMTRGKGKNKKFRKGKDWDSGIPSAEYFAELFRVSKNQIIWGGNYFTEFLPPSRNWLVWDKKNAGRSFAEGELAWMRDGNGLRIFPFCSTHQGVKYHPTQKPIALYDWIFAKYAKPGFKILDTHLGSGSSRIAAHNAGLDFVGIEIDPEYFQMSVERFDNATAQMSLT